MKKIIIAMFCVALFACNNESKESTAEEKPPVPTNMYGFTPEYSASFVMGDAKNTEAILSIWNDWKTGDLGPSRANFADSLSLFLADGSSMTGLSDTLLKNMQGYRSTFKGMEVKVDAIFPVKSTDKNENWVAVWGTEVQTDMNGKVDSVSIQETWRFDKNGKIDLMFQSLRKGITPPPEEK